MRKSVLVVSVSVSLAIGLGFCHAAMAGQVFAQHNLVSNGGVPADLVDPDLVNPWGLVHGPTSPWWVADNEPGVSTLYDGSGAKLGLTVTIGGNPTGAVFNGGTGFVVDDGNGHSGASLFIFANEDGTIKGWSPGVPPPAPSTQAFVGVDNSDSGAVYKGLALASTSSGDFLYATNFHAGTVDVFDSSFQPAPMPGAFTDPDLPAGYAPFGIANLGGTLYVTYALQDDDKHDDVAGKGHGFVDAFDTAGTLLWRVASRDSLNSPWGLVIVPAGLGKLSGDLLVGNFGDGHILAFDAKHKADDFHHGKALHGTDGMLLMIDGLWSLAFGNDHAAGPMTTLFFTAGPNGEHDGLFGTLTAEERPDGHDDEPDDDADD